MHYDQERLVFIDETGTHISMTNTHGWVPCGERINDYVPWNRGTVSNMFGALTIGGLEAVMNIEMSMDSSVLNAFITVVVAHRLNAGDVVILDNVSAHKNEKTKQHLDKMGVELVFLPPYSPDMNPIAVCWSKVKSVLRRFCARTIEGLDSAIASAAEAVTPTDAAGWFAHAGYRVRTNGVSSQLEPEPLSVPSPRVLPDRNHELSEIGNINPLRVFIARG